ncbi:MAG TPA: cell wall-binding repeat-containing protein [Conexibacter sp.]|nr:cell wall-binding repeat-containing protein [Conexibacter sp.]
MSRRVRLAPGGIAPLLALVGLLASGCGGQPRTLEAPQLGSSGNQANAPQALGFPGFATKNTTRVGGADAVADAAAVARAVYPGGAPGTRPRAVVLADAHAWQAALAASVLMSAPLRAPLLLADGGNLPAASKDALDALAPSGASELNGAQVIRIGDAPAPAGYRSSTIAGTDPVALAARIDGLQSTVVGHASRAVVVASADDPAYAMPAAGWAAKTGNPLLFVHRDTIPGPTFAALQAHRAPHIYLLAPPAVVGGSVEGALRAIGPVTRISAPDAVRSAIAFARLRDGLYGWNVVDPGHGLVFANARRTLDAAAAAPLSASGTYGPLLLVARPNVLPLPVGSYLLDIQPGYTQDPTRALYNHGWLIGDENAISLPVQSRIDSFLEAAPIQTNATP